MAAGATAGAGGLMGVLGDVVGWFSDPARWGGSFGIPNRVLEHVQMSGLAIAIAIAIALPVGVYIGHTRRFELVAVSVGNFGRALPSFAILALVFPLTFELPGELGFWPTLIALTVLGIPPILLNTYVGVRDVDPDAREAARGMGMSGGDLLLELELPLAARLVVAGIRTAAVQIVATATLAAFVAWGGLGRYIVDGTAAGDDAQIVGGAVLVALLALATEGALGVVERIVRPRTTSRRDRDGDSGYGSGLAIHRRDRRLGDGSATPMGGDVDA